MLVLSLFLFPLAVGPVLAGPAAGHSPQVEFEPSASQDDDLTGPTLENQNQSEIVYANLHGRGLISNQKEIVIDHPGDPFVWEDESLELRVSVRTTSNETYHVCGRILDEEREEIDTFGCDSGNTSMEYLLLDLKIEEWPTDAKGTHYIELELTEESDFESADNESTDDEETADSFGDSKENVTIDTYETRVYIMAKEGDLSENGLTNAREVQLGTDFTREDTSGNGLTDWDEVHQYGTDPLKADTTGDGVDDGTIARFSLPPTVPYILHFATFVTGLGLIGISLAGFKLRNWLQSVQQTQESTTTVHETTGEQAVTETQPMTKEDEILTILQEHGGQMKQTDLVSESEWSKATVSRLLTSLEEQGYVEKVRIGRGNVVKLLDSPTQNHRTQSL